MDRLQAINITVGEILGMVARVPRDRELQAHMMTFVHDLEAMRKLPEAAQESLLGALTTRAQAGIL